MPRQLQSRGKGAPDTHRIRGRVGPKAGIEGVKRRNILPLPGLELRPFCRPASSQSLYRLSYPDSQLWFGKLLNYQVSPSVNTDKAVITDACQIWHRLEWLAMLVLAHGCVIYSSLHLARMKKYPFL
jgi:hypothetical protein